MHFYLVRHGQSYINLPEWDSIANRDEPLTPTGEQQVEAVAQWINANIRANYLFASDIQRARQTAEAITHYTGHTINYDHRIREIGCNAPDGSSLPNDELPHYIEGVWGTLKPYDPVTQNGENWMQFRSRIGSFIEEKLAKFNHATPATDEDRAEQSCIVVCHGGVIEAFFEYIFQKGPWSVVSVMTHNTGITHFRYQPRPNRPDWVLYYQNKLEHLTPDLIT